MEADSVSAPSRAMWRWRVYDDVTQRLVITRHHMDEETARARYPDAERIEWTRMEVRDFGTASHLMSPRG